MNKISNTSQNKNLPMESPSIFSILENATWEKHEKMMMSQGLIVIFYS
jgi:hypothetical protein